MPQRYLYIDNLSSYDLSFTNVLTTQTSYTKSEIMMSIIGEEQSDFCSLPTYCTCPIQRTLQITPEYSINPFANKGTERVYSYNEEQDSIYVITNSISSSEFCR